MIRDTVDSMPVHHWTIKAWHWVFNGAFQRQYDTLKFSIQGAIFKHVLDAMAHECLDPRSDADESEASALNITDLEVVPLKHVSSDIVEKLRRRGRTFWKCRVRNFVSYQEHENNDTENHVSSGICFQTNRFLPELV